MFFLDSNPVTYSSSDFNYSGDKFERSYLLLASDTECLFSNLICPVNPILYNLSYKKQMHEFWPYALFLSSTLRSGILLRSFLLSLIYIYTVNCPWRSIYFESEICDYKTFVSKLPVFWRRNPLPDIFILRSCLMYNFFT